MSQEDGSTSSIGGFDPLVFWGVNVFIFALLFAACAFYCYCFQGTGNGRPGATESDRIYHDTILRRQREALERKRESPQVRQHKIEQAILRYGVRMVVQEVDLTRPTDETLMIKVLSSFGSVVGESSDEDPAILDDDSNVSSVQSVDDAYVLREKPSAGSLLEVHLADDEITPAAVCQNNKIVNEILDVEMGAPVSADVHQADENFEVDTAVEECESGYLMLPCQHQVPNCCAICLCPYEVAETVIWSNNKACKHAFHEECISEWLLKLHEGTSCPCCRQEFLSNTTTRGAQQRPVNWAPGAFDASAISFR